jgi:hypothetical protein
MGDLRGIVDAFAVAMTVGLTTGNPIASRSMIEDPIERLLAARRDNLRRLDMAFARTVNASR